MIGMVKLDCGCVGFQLREQDCFLILETCEDPSSGDLGIRHKSIRSDAELTPLIPSEVQDVISRFNVRESRRRLTEEQLQKIKEVVSILTGSGVQS